MTRQEPGSLLSPEVSIQNRSIDRSQIHQHQSVQRIAEMRIDVESKQFGVQLQILAQQNRYALSVPFRLGHEPIRFLNRPWDGLRRCWVHHARVDGFHQRRKIAVEMILLKKRHQEAV